MGLLRNLTNLTFGRLVVVKRDGSDAQRRATWLCKCTCGREKVVPSRHLISGVIISCGCYGREVAAKNGKIGAPKISGKMSHLYDSSLTDEHRLATRNVIAIREWRKRVFSRDNYICDLCGIRGGKLVAHHLNCWSKYPEERFDINNGITICESHHKVFHRALGTRTPCTYKDYEEFKREIDHLDE